MLVSTEGKNYSRGIRLRKYGILNTWVTQYLVCLRTLRFVQVRWIDLHSETNRASVPPTSTGTLKLMLMLMYMHIVMCIIKVHSVYFTCSYSPVPRCVLFCSPHIQLSSPILGTSTVAYFVVLHANDVHIPILRKFLYKSMHTFVSKFHPPSTLHAKRR